MTKHKRTFGRFGAVILTGSMCLMTWQCGTQPSADLVIRDVTILPMTGGAPAPDRAVVVTDGRIERIVPATEAVRATREVDGRGGYLLPSFADTHVHVCDSGDLLTFLTHGVGAIRNMQGDPYQLILRDAIERGSLVGPRLRTAGPYVASWNVETPEAAAETARRQARAGYDVIKLHGELELASLEALGAAADEAGIPVIGHIPRDQDFADVAPTGVMREVSHAEEYLYTLFARRPDATTEEIIDEAVRLTSEAGIRVAPTLTTYLSILEQVGDVERAMAETPLDAIGPFAVRAFTPARNRYASRFSPSDTVWLADAFARQVELVRAFSRAGVEIVVGTDANNPMSTPGHSLHRELELLVRAGLTEEEALIAATANGWRAISPESGAGTVVEGAAAELVLLSANPLDDIRHTREIAGIVRAGRWLARDSLESEVTRLAGIRRGESALVDRLWDNTIDDAVTWLDSLRAAGGELEVRPATWRCQSVRAVRDGVPDVAREALRRALAVDASDSLATAYLQVLTGES